MRNVYLYAPNFISGIGSVTTVWLPYAVGAIWSYAVTNPRVKDNFNLAGFGILRDPVDQVVNSLDCPSICAFSNYVWNEQYNLHLSRVIKQRYPECTIIFGGPSIPNGEDDHRAWRAENSWIDITIRYEGEHAFQEVLLDILDGRPKRDYVAQRLFDLDVPSPYLTGLFDDLVKDRRHQYAMTFETNRGCPFACTFCDWGGLTYSKIKSFPLEKVFAEIEWAGKNGIEFVMLTDANFGVFPDRDRAIVQKLVETKRQYGFPQQLQTNWYKNSNQTILDIAQELTAEGLNRGLTLSVQSMNDATLTAIKRKNMRINDLSTLFQDCNRRQIPFYTELILGLPEETLDSWRQGHFELLEMGQHGCVFVFPVELLRNSALVDDQEKYGITVTEINDYWQCELSGINERQSIITGTSTLSTEDFVNATIFSWMIVTFHHHGWCEMYARYLRSQGWSFQQIYESLEAWLPSDEYFNQQMQTIRVDVEKFFHSGQSAGYYAIWNTVRALYLDVESNHQRLAGWFRSICKDPFVEQVVEIQRAFIFCHQDPQIKTINQPNNLIDVILDSEVPLQHHFQQYQFTNPSAWSDQDQFLAYVILRRKEGFGKARITAKISQPESLECAS
jgi:putative methyltransferase